jgi:hypothetical protein
MAETKTQPQAESDVVVIESGKTTKTKRDARAIMHFNLFLSML